MWTKAKVLGFKFLSELSNLARQKGTFEGDIEPAHGKIEELFIGPRYPRGLALTQIRGRSGLRTRHSFPQTLYTY